MPQPSPLVCLCMLALPPGLTDHGYVSAYSLASLTTMKIQWIECGAYMSVTSRPPVILSEAKNLISK